MFTHVTIINDCRDSATANREITRVSALTGLPVSFVGIHDFADLEGAGCIIDTVDALTGRPGIIIANAAPRHGKGKKYSNGTPFCYLWIGKTLLISSIQGYMLGLVRKLKLADSLYLLDIPTVVAAMVKKGELDTSTAGYISQSQFRSFDFQPRVADWLIRGIALPSSQMDLDTYAEILPIEQAIWSIDNFGNCKTTMLPEEIDFVPGRQVETLYGTATMHQQLRDVSDGQLALTIGSSGYAHKRFIELVIQGASVAAQHELRVGDKVFADI